MMFPGLGIPSDRESTVMLPVLLPMTTFGFGRLDGAEEIPLVVEHLADGLHHVAASLDGLDHVGGHHALDAGHHLVDGLVDEVELDELLHVLPDLAESPSQRFLAAGDESHVEPVLSEGLRDAFAHGPRANDQYLLCVCCAHAWPPGNRPS